MIRALSFLVGPMAFAASASFAADVRVKTEAGASASWAGPESFQAASGFAQANALSGGARLMWSDQIGQAFGEVHINANGAVGSLADYANSVSASSAPPASLFDLSAQSSHLNINVDRAFLTFTTENTVLTIGRQAITWGGGFVFRPMDIVAPFAPNAIDTSYKPGVEMIYGQFLFDNGGDLQSIVVPRPSVAGGGVERDASTFAVLGSTSFGAIDARGLLARDRGTNVTGLGLSGPIGGASWSAEWVGLKSDTGDLKPFWIANFSNFTTFGDWNLSYFAEVFHNGLGVPANIPLDELPSNLSDRMGFGQIFLPGRNFLAIGGNIQVSPDFSFAPSMVVNLDDKSALMQMGAAWSLGDNTDVFIDYSSSVGHLKTEFGGRETSAGSGIYASTGRNASVRMIKYF